MKFVLPFILLSSLLNGASLSRMLNGPDLDQIVETVGFSSAVRLMRSTESYETFPGIKIGFDIPMIPNSSLNNLGDRSGSLPSLIPAPRFYLAKGLFQELELIFVFFSPKFLDIIATYGGILKWNFLKEDEQWFSSAVYFGWTHINAFKESFTGNDTEVGIYISKDYVRIKPYVGAALLFGYGEIARNLALHQRNSLESTVHFFSGCEIEMPVNISIQADLIRFSPSFSLMLAKKF